MPLIGGAHESQELGDINDQVPQDGAWSATSRLPLVPKGPTS
jgi:hypothetical protein